MWQFGIKPSEVQAVTNGKKGPPAAPESPFNEPAELITRIKAALFELETNLQLKTPDALKVYEATWRPVTRRFAASEWPNKMPELKRYLTVDALEIMAAYSETDKLSALLEKHKHQMSSLESELWHLQNGSASSSELPKTKADI